VTTPIRLGGLLLLSALLVTAGAPARADVFYDSGDASVATTDDGEIYFGIGAAAYWFTAPERRNVGTIYQELGTILESDVLHFQPDDVSPMYGATLGWVLDPEDGEIGSNVRVELTGHWFQMEDARSATVAPAFWWDFLSLNGTGYVDDVPSPGSPRNFDLESHYRYFDAGALVRTDIAFGPLVVSPSAGLQVHRLREHTSMQFFGAGTEFNRIREDVETWYGGGTFGTQFVLPIVSGLSIHAGGTAWLSYFDSDYEGDQTYISVPGGAHVDDGKDGFAFRGTASGGATVSVGPVSLSLTGGIDFWDFAARIRQPQAPLGVMYNSVSQTDSAKITRSDMVNYFAGATLAIRLP
jgi:hypothetical protein